MGDSVSGLCTLRTLCTQDSALGPTLLPKSKSPTYAFLANNRPKDRPKSDHNLLDLLHGTALVPDDKYQTFLDKYLADHAKYAFGFVELRNHVFPYLLDLDFHSGSPQDRARWLCDILQALHHSVVQPLLHSYADELGVGVDVDDIAHRAHLAVFKDAQVSTRGGLKFHVVFPSILVTTRHALIFNRVLRNALRATPMHEVPDWNKVIDDSVVSSNGLRMLGSYKAIGKGSKPDIDAGCYVPCDIDFHAKTLRQLLPITKEALFKHSIHWTQERIDAAYTESRPRIRTSYSQDQATHAIRFNLLQIADPDRPDGPRTGPPRTQGLDGRGSVPLHCLRKAVLALPPTYYQPGSYTTWSPVVWAIRNVALVSGYPEDGRKLAHDFSRQDAASYDPRAVDRLFDSAKDHGALIYRGSIMRELRISGAPAELLAELRAHCAAHLQDSVQQLRDQSPVRSVQSVQSPDTECRRAE